MCIQQHYSNIVSAYSAWLTRWMLYHDDDDDDDECPTLLYWYPKSHLRYATAARYISEESKKKKRVRAPKYFINLAQVAHFADLKTRRYKRLFIVVVIKCAVSFSNSFFLMFLFQQSDHLRITGLIKIVKSDIRCIHSMVIYSRYMNLLCLCGKHLCVVLTCTLG